MGRRKTEALAEAVVTRPYLDAWTAEEFVVLTRDLPEGQLLKDDLLRLVQREPVKGDMGFERDEKGCRFFLCEGDKDFGICLRIRKARGGWRKEVSLLDEETRYWIIAESCRGWLR